MRRLLVSALALALLVAGLVACSDSTDDDRDGDGSTETSEGGAIDSTLLPAQLELLDAGAEPRTELRYAYVAGTTERVATTTVIDQTVDGASPGPITTTIEVDIEVVSVEEGVADLRLTYGEPQVETAPGAPPQVVASVEEGAGVMAGAVAQARVNPLGQVLELDLQLAEDESGLAARLQAALSAGLEQQGVAFPPEPVGIGARWLLRSEADTDGVSSVTEQTFTIVDVDATGVDLAVTTTGAFGSGATGTSTGSGTMRVSFGSIFPELESSSVNELTSQGSEVTQTITQLIRRL